MKTLLFAFFVALLLVVGAFLVLDNEPQNKRRELIKELPLLACDLNEKPCEYEFKGQKVRVEFKENPVQALVENELVVENLGDFSELNARIYGLNMYMGDVVPTFKKTSANSYKAAVVPSACVIDTMRFRVEFFNGKKPINFYFDFDIKR